MNVRVAVTDVGNGWFRIAMVARKTSAATTLTARIYMATANNTSTYTGDGASLFYVWRAGLAPSGVAFFPGQTTTTANAGASPSGNSMRLKGLPASSGGLLLPGDWIETGLPATIESAAVAGHRAAQSALDNPIDNSPSSIGNLQSAIVNRP